jgi:YegS/Rv2252/BmrU family lipid kinase
VDAGEVVFLVNPASANGSTGRRWPELAHQAAEAGVSGETLLSSRPGEIADLAEQAARGGAATVVVVGGDGTVNETVNGLMRVAGEGGRLPVLGVLPRGTGTDFARTFGIPSDVTAAMATVRDGKVGEIDVGRVEFRGWDGSQAVAYFANVASAGMSGAVAQRANASSKALGGKMSFLAATLAVFARWKPSEVEVDVDGEPRAGLMYDVIVANCRFLAGGMKMTPEATPDDGLFDVLLIGNITRRDLALTLPKVYRGTHLPHPKAELLRGRSVVVRSATPLPIELDGEQPGTTPVRFEVVPAALRLRVP